MNINNNYNLISPLVETNGPHNYNVKIKESFKNLFELFKEFIDKTYNKLSKKHENIDSIIFEIKKSFEDLDKLLNNMDDYKEEYLDFRSIKRISFSLLDNKTLLFENFSIIESMLNLFSNIINTKLTVSQEKYEIEYEKFSLNLLDCKKKYYTNIFKKSENYDDEQYLSKIIHDFFKEE